jgi:hypothetical protein
MRKRFVLFRGQHFEDVIIMLCVRWYLRYSLSFLDLEDHGGARPFGGSCDLVVSAMLRAHSESASSTLRYGVPIDLGGWMKTNVSPTAPPAFTNSESRGFARDHLPIPIDSR